METNSSDTLQGATGDLVESSPPCPFAAPSAALAGEQGASEVVRVGRVEVHAPQCHWVREPQRPRVQGLALYRRENIRWDASSSGAVVGLVTVDVVSDEGHAEARRAVDSNLVCAARLEPQLQQTHPALRERLRHAKPRQGVFARASRIEALARASLIEVLAPEVSREVGPKHRHLEAVFRVPADPTRHLTPNCVTP
eukprot:CAMPEP_0181260250 /NCGR_PEP_ID=MMETSP1097-20121128/845_1 /TAXON_ID=35684 /ORGANISM="Pseudopedinella elastica, Strain CCMP716" /LENGTH=196 /DNA_ID=CAMNT_0023358755 /DNA_START=66 /DNA_END=658 /DNA_ORIENTATION=-